MDMAKGAFSCTGDVCRFFDNYLGMPFQIIYLNTFRETSIREIDTF